MNQNKDSPCCWLSLSEAKMNGKKTKTTTINNHFIAWQLIKNSLNHFLFLWSVWSLQSLNDNWASAASENDLSIAVGMQNLSKNNTIAQSGAVGENLDCVLLFIFIVWDSRAEYFPAVFHSIKKRAETASKRFARLVWDRDNNSVPLQLHISS